MNADMPTRQTILIGGSYPGALSAWLRSTHPHLSVGAWSASGVVQPIADFWQYDEQVYLSTKKSGDWCPELMAAQNIYATE